MSFGAARELILLDLGYSIGCLVRECHLEAVGPVALNRDAMKRDDQLRWIDPFSVVDVSARFATSHLLFIVNNQVLAPQQHVLKLDRLGELNNCRLASRCGVAAG